MRPVSLKLAGLHSFREPQVVDFERLCEAGLFGIFGATGSGKSTVLDAITLALYGKVERAAHGTQGILNHAEDRVSVELTFELDQPEGRKLYRVERLYRRSGDNSVVSAGSRLVEISGAHEIPLAEKSRVNLEIEAMLGLTSDDFTRAVVLPQGKFDEFLKKIKPAERRRMLERLFGLTEYGDRLKQKVDRRLNEAANKLASVRGELDGLGEASDEALERTQKILEEAGRRADEANRLCRQAEKEHGDLAQVWAWQEEMSSVERSLAVLAERRPDIEAARDKLDTAVRAGKALPFLLEADEAESNFTKAEGNFTEITAGLAMASESAEATEKALKNAADLRRKEEPLLLEEKGRLARAVELEKETAKFKKEESGLAALLENLQGERERNRTVLQKSRTEKSDVEKEIGIIKESIANAQVAPERRRQVAAALLALHKWKQAEEESRKAKAGRDKKENLLAEAQAALEEAAAAEQEKLEALNRAAGREKELQEKRPEDSAKLSEAAREVERLRSWAGMVGRLALAVNEAAAYLKEKNAGQEKAVNTANQAKDRLAEGEFARDEARRQVQSLEEKLDGLRRRNIAFFLAGSLKEGDPCPVCGSAEHPAPAAADEEAKISVAEEKLREARILAERAQKSLEKLQREEFAASAGMNAALVATREAESRLESLQAEMNAARGELPAGWTGLSVADLEQELARREGWLAQRQQAWVDWQKDMEEAQRTLEQARDSHNRAAVARAGAESARIGAASTLQDAGDRALAAAAEELGRLAELDAARGVFKPGQIPEEQRRIEELDARRSELDKKRAELEKRLGRIALEIDKMAALDGELAVQVTENRQKLAGMRELLGQKEEELVQITGSRPAGLLLEKADARLKNLAEAERQAQEEARRANKKKCELEQNRAAAEEALNIAKVRLEKGLARLDKSLAELRFATRNEARQACLSAAEQEALQKSLDDYDKERERLAGLSRNLKEKLAGRELSASEWQKCKDSLAIARREQEEALTAWGAAARECEKMTLANARWKDLSREYESTGIMKGRLDVLKDLLRGNAFVDFLAEEQFVKVAIDASARLGQLTRHRYALEVDSEGGFVIRDEANGGVKRPVSTLSGGETFVASLALALALSAQIQLKGRYPLEFFFLDEGFGSLDPELLEVVVSTLERLRLEHLNIGVISHVPELKNRLPRRLIVHPAEPSGAGSRLELEMA